MEVMVEYQLLVPVQCIAKTHFHRLFESSLASERRTFRQQSGEDPGDN